MALRIETPEIIRLVEQLSQLASESAETTVGARYGSGSLGYNLPKPKPSDASGARP